MADELQRRWQLWKRGSLLRSVVVGGEYVTIVISRTAVNSFSSGIFGPGDTVWRRGDESSAAIILGIGRHRLWAQYEHRGKIVGYTRDTLQHMIDKQELVLLHRAPGWFLTLDIMSSNEEENVKLFEKA